jgi:hypothetical protein
MASFLPEDLTDTVYRAALEPAAWHDVMELMGSSFPSVAQTFYFLHLGPRHVRPVQLSGIEPRWVTATVRFETCTAVDVVGQSRRL